MKLTRARVGPHCVYTACVSDIRLTQWNADVFVDQIITMERFVVSKNHTMRMQQGIRKFL